jgi:hypothetical protein
MMPGMIDIRKQVAGDIYKKYKDKYKRLATYAKFTGSYEKEIAECEEKIAAWEKIWTEYYGFDVEELKVIA